LYGIPARNPLIIVSVFGDKNILIVNGAVQTNLDVSSGEVRNAQRHLCRFDRGDIYQEYC